MRSSNPQRTSAQREPIDPSKVHLERGTGSKGRGGDRGGSYWHVMADGTRVGYVYVNVIDQPPLGEHASIKIQLNKTDHGRGIGTIAYGLAVEDSGHDTVYAEMRKSNLASRRAAEKAGFQVVEDPERTQLLMVWRRP
jgi:RimJ/RimL family protein N-acetyltransferase